MSLERTLLLGFLAGVTILLGLPVGRMRRPAPEMRTILNALAIGILLFLVWDVLSGAWEPIDQALSDFHDGKGRLGSAFGYGALFIAGLAVGLLSLVFYERWMARRAAGPKPPGAAGGQVQFGPGAMRAGELRRTTSHATTWSPARRLALLIAVGIGLHNFAEGLAIGQSAAANQLKLAIPLVIGFGLHNATEGFGIVAPLAAERDVAGEMLRPSWAFLLLLGLIGGGPTFVGTLVGHAYVSAAMSVVFLTLAAGSILYVVVQLLGVASKAKRPDLLAYGLLLGLVAGFATDAIVSASGA